MKKRRYKIRSKKQKEKREEEIVKLARKKKWTEGGDMKAINVPGISVHLMIFSNHPLTSTHKENGIHAVQATDTVIHLFPPISIQRLRLEEKNI